MIKVHTTIRKYTPLRTVYVSLFLVAIYFILLSYYRNFIAVDYDYMGFLYDPENTKFYLSFLIFLIFVFLSFIIYNNGDFYYSVYILFLILFFIPASILYYCMNLPHKWYELYVITILILFVSSFLKIRVKEFHLNRKQESLFLFGILILIGLPFYLNMGSYQVNFRVLLFEDIYETREAFAAHSSASVNYSYFWLIKLIAPVLFIYGMIRKRYLFSIISFSLLTYIYLVSGHRTVYFALIILLVFYKLSKTYSGKVALLSFAILIAGLIIAPLVDAVFSSRLFRFMFAERTFFDQSLMTYYYYDFFQGKPIFFSESMLFDRIFDYPYELPSANLIGKAYFNNPEAHANTGFIGDAFMSLGTVGVILISGIVSLIFSFFNSLDIDERYFGLFILYVFDFQNSSFLAIIFSGGLLFLMIFALLIMKKKHAI